MERQANGHTAEFLKRQAKKIKTEQGITHLQALDQAAKYAGFTNWNHFLNQSSPREIKKPQPKEPILPVPKPSTLSFRIPFGRGIYYRPNGRMPISAHKRLGGLLTGLKTATEYKNNRAFNALSTVSHQLDEWLQKEYASRQELSDEVFFEIYYGQGERATEDWPSEQRKAALKRDCREAQSILSSNYHDCRPLRELLQHLDRAIKWIDAWPKIKTERYTWRRGNEVALGSLVYLKMGKKPAILISHQRHDGRIVCYSDAGLRTTSRESITVPKNQLAAAEFKPMRLWLPYGLENCDNGEQILFNRDYTPLWKKTLDGLVSVAPAEAQVTRSKTEFFFNDGSAPWHQNNESFDRCLEVLRSWGVEHIVPGPLALLKEAVAKGDPSLVKPGRV